MRFHMNTVNRVLTISCVLALGCNKSDLAGPTDGNCRTYATQFTRQITRATFVTPREASTCTFDQGAGTLSCEGSLTKPPGCTGRLTTRGMYRSAADFVGEASAAGLTFQTQEVESFFADCAESGTGTVNYAYDAQGRLMGRSFVGRTTLSTGAASVTYTAWDGARRPTRGTLVTEGAAPCALSIVYGGRTIESTATCQTASAVEKITFDANANIVEIQHTRGGTLDSTEIRTIDRTAAVCVPAR
jgi:hypothetical protein